MEKKISHNHVHSDDIMEMHQMISQKWVTCILHSMCACGGTMRFSDIEKSLPYINANILSQRLSDLEKQGLVERVVTNNKPVQINYKLTPKAAELKKIFKELARWSQKWARKK